MKKLFVSISAMALMACSVSQAPAPVVDGYGKGPASQRIKQSTHVESAYVAEEKIIEESADTITNRAVDFKYEVSQGDSVNSIADKFNISRDTLIALNSLEKPYILMIGQQLHLPTTAKAPAEEIQSQTARLSKPAKTEKAEVLEVKKADITPKKSKPKYSIHKVKRGENLFRIGKKYGISFIDIMALNDMKKPQDLQAGMRLRVPVAGESVSTFEQEEAISFTTAEKNKLVKKYSKTKGLIWPVRGRVIKTYGKGGHGISNTGINISAPTGKEVLAAENGTVIYADDGLESYGNLVLLRHRRGYVTAYGHTGQLLVKRGEKVAKGQIIATVGQTGNVDKPQLHFEVRRNARAVNPQSLLPRS